jgi:glucose/arabinose dehydrogenase
VLAGGLLLALLVTRLNPTSGVAVGGPSGRPGSARPPAGSGGPPFDPARVAVTLERVAGGLDAPLAVVNAGDGSGRLFVAEQGGRVRIVTNGSVSPEPFLDITDRLSSGGERGLLGIAFHPRYPDDPRVFVDYTDRQGDTRVSSFVTAPGSGDRLDPASEVNLLHIEQPFANHNGGGLVFDPDGHLLIAMGDGGSGGDPRGNGQSLETLLAKVLRIDVDAGAGQPGGPRYGIPADNPYADDAGGRRPEIWLTGLRNPWRISIDRATGDLWIGDVGQGAREEIDVQRAATPGGTNFGWNRMEGTQCFEPKENCQDPALALPVSDYGRDLGSTVIGGVVARGPAATALSGGYVFADYGSGRLFAIDPARDDYQAPVEIGQSEGSPSAFGEGEDGAVYVTDIAAGELQRVVATGR